MLMQVWDDGVERGCELLELASHTKHFVQKMLSSRRNDERWRRDRRLHDPKVGMRCQFHPRDAMNTRLRYSCRTNNSHESTRSVDQYGREFDMLSVSP